VSVYCMRVLRVMHVPCGRLQGVSGSCNILTTPTPTATATATGTATTTSTSCPLHSATPPSCCRGAAHRGSRTLPAFRAHPAAAVPRAHFPSSFRREPYWPASAAFHGRGRVARSGIRAVPTVAVSGVAGSSSSHRA